MQPNEKEVVKVSRFARSLDVLFRFDEELLRVWIDPKIP